MEEASKAVAEGNAPYGAVLTDKNGNLIASAHNTARSSCDPTAHGEMNLLRKASQLLKARDLGGVLHFFQYRILFHVHVRMHQGGNRRLFFWILL